jgi:imidazolonepropionase-like amidohydrolase
MKKCIIFLSSLFLCGPGFSQDNIYPAPEFKGTLFIKNATVHTGTGQVLMNTSVLVNNGKIEKIGEGLTLPPGNVSVYDATGKHLYPGIILSNTNTGLKEIANQVRGSNDFNELGELNPNIQSIVAYNTDSKIINTLRSNGILLANIVPGGQLLAGSSSVAQFDAWTYEDAVYKSNGAQHFYMPSLFNLPRNEFTRGPRTDADIDPLKAAMERIEKVKLFLREARAYHNQKNRAFTNLKFESVKGLFDQSQRFFVHCNLVKEMLVAAEFAKEFGFRVTIVGGSESYQIAPLLKENNISVILQQVHSLPTSEDDDIDQPFKTPAALQAAGVLFAITDEDGQTTGRNLVFNAGTAAAYGLTKEDALQAITLNPAKILGIAERTGSIETGKDANIIISEGDILDMRTSIITKAFIQGRDINLDDKHKQLNERYRKKYGIQ